MRTSLLSQPKRLLMRDGTASQTRTLRILQVAISGTVGTMDAGPVSTDICALANGLHRLGHEVTVTDAPEALPRQRLDPGVRVEPIRPGTHRLPLLNFAPRVFRLYLWLCAIGYVYSLCRRLRLRDFDVIHVHHQRIAFILAMVTGVEYYYTSHTPIWALDLAQGRKLGIGRRFEAMIERTALRKASAGIALGDFMAPAVPAVNLVTIPNGTTLSRWQRMDRADARAATNISAGDFVVLFVGRLHTLKGVDVLIEAIRRLAPDRPRLSVVIIGPHGGNFRLRGCASPYVEKLLAAAKELPVRFTGFVSNQSPEFLEYLSACDVAVFPSRVEAQGTVVMEALAMSVPVIASRTGGMADIVSDDVGFLVPPDDVEALTTAIGTVYEHPELLDALRPNCRRRIEDHYNWDHVVKRHLRLFEETLTATACGEREVIGHVPPQKAVAPRYRRPEATKPRSA